MPRALTPIWPPLLPRAILAGAVSALLLVLPAQAHKKRTVRKAVATVRVAPADAEHSNDRLMVDVMLWQRIAGERANLFRGRFDIDRSGAFNAGESVLAGNAGAPEAIGGLVLERDGAPVAPKRADAKARLVDGAVEIAVLLSWELGPVDGIGVTTVGLRARADRARPDAPALVVELGALAPLITVGGAPSLRGEVVGPHPAIAGGRAVQVEVLRAQTVPGG